MQANKNIQLFWCWMLCPVEMDLRTAHRFYSTATHVVRNEEGNKRLSTTRAYTYILVR